MMSPDYAQFMMSLWLSCDATPQDIADAITAGRITQAEADSITATPRDCP